MNTDSEEIAAARKNVERAISEFVKVIHKERDDEYVGEEPYVLSFGAYAEYVTGTMQLRDITSHVVVVPDDQGYATSRGIFELAKDCFSK